MYSIHKISGMLLSLELEKHPKMDGSWPDWQKQKSCQCGTELRTFQYNMLLEQLSWRGSVPSQMDHLHNVGFKVVTALLIKITVF